MAPSSIVSTNGFIHVLAFSPSEGEHGIPITVRVHLSPDLADAIFVRLLLANKPLPTKVTQLPDVSYGCWQLHAAAPPLEHLHSNSTKVLISVQALNDDNAVLDSLTFGQFTYWAQEPLRRRRRSVASITKLPRLQIPNPSAPRRRSAHDRPSTPSSTTSDRSFYPKSPHHRTTRLHHRMKPGSLIRTKQANAAPAGQGELHASTPILELATPLSSMCTGWTNAEAGAGRRLVRFRKVQDGCRLIVSCEPVSQDDYHESDTVISCIYREEVDSCYVTSVDVIYLLERLTSGEFPVEEKNRIRRNLEGLRPTTVSKHKPGFGNFFQRIMDFPDPRPRNIEKDLKVFDWSLLGQALEKILSKYTIYTSDPETTDSSPVDTPATAEFHLPQISYPPPDDLGVSRFLDEQLNASASRLSRSLPKNIAFADGPERHTSQGAAVLAPEIMHSFPSPVDSISSSVSVPELIAGIVEGGEPQNTLTSDNTVMNKDAVPWVVPGQNAQDLGTGMDEFATLASFDMAEPRFEYANNPTLGYDFGYDNFAFFGLSDEAINTLADQYL